MEELRAHATDWTQNIQNMSMDFRIPNPLEFNDPFLLQRRRWKRSGRRRIRRGAQCTVGYWVPGGSENGHLPNRWAGLSSSMSQLEARSSLERATATKSRPRVSAAAGGTVLKASKAPDPALGLTVESRSFPHPLGRSLSLPVACSASELDTSCAAMPGESLSGSESPFGSRSDGSSVALSLELFAQVQQCRTTSSREEAGVRVTETVKEQNQGPSPEEHVGADTGQPPPTPGLPRTSSVPAPEPFPLNPVLLLPSHPLNVASSASCQLLDFFGENLAYIDESSDTLSDRTQPAASEERRRRPRKPKRRSIRTHKWSPLQARRPKSDMQPPSNPPTPPPQPPVLELPQSEELTAL